VRVTITIRPRSGSRTFEAGIEIVNAAPGLQYRPAVDRVLVTVGGTLEALDAVDASGIAARLDVVGMGAGTTAVPVDLRLPPGVTVVAVSPEAVSVTATGVTSTPGPTPTPALSPAP